MAGELEAVAREVMAAFDQLDVAKMTALFTDDAQGVDEISRKWMRGRAAMDAYFTQFGPMLSDIHSALGDVHESAWGDTGVVTAWMEQDYKAGGEPVHFSGPVTMIMRRAGGAWRVALIHAVPMPPAD